MVNGCSRKIDCRLTAPRLWAAHPRGTIQIQKAAALKQEKGRSYHGSDTNENRRQHCIPAQSPGSDPGTAGPAIGCVCPGGKQMGNRQFLPGHYPAVPSGPGAGHQCGHTAAISSHFVGRRGHRTAQRCVGLGHETESAGRPGAPGRSAAAIPRLRRPAIHGRRCL